MRVSRRVGASMVVAVILGASIAPLSAQRSGWSAEGAFVLNRDARDSRLPADVVGGGAGFIYQTYGRWSVRFDFYSMRTRGYESTATTQNADGTRRIGRSHSTFRPDTFGVLAGLRFRASQAVDLALTFGGATESRHFRLDVSRDTVDASGTVLVHEVIDAGPIAATTSRWLQFGVGLDADVHLTDRLSIVPEGRLWFTPQLGDGCCTGAHWTSRVALRLAF